MTPCEIEVLLHCYYSPEPHPRLHAMAVMDAHVMFEKLGAIRAAHDDGTNYYETTDLGKAWVQSLMNVECPRPAYIDAQGKVIWP